MGKFAERVGNLRIRADSSDGHITARLSGGSRLDIEFADGAYHRYDENELASQLAELLRTLFADYRTARLDALSQTTMEISGLPAEPVDPRQLDRRGREFHRRRAELESRGKSAGDVVRVSRTGRSDWTVRIRPGSLRRHDEQGFKRELASGISAAQSDYRELVGALRVEIFS